MSALSKQECQNELLKNIDLNITIVVENKLEPSSDQCSTRCLKNLPVFILKDINLHRLSNGKDRNTVISKTLERRRKFKNEDYLRSDSIFTKCSKNTFPIKARCNATIKRIKRDVAVTLTRKTSRVEKAKCSCPAGASSYCNHIMTLPFEIADYSLKGLTEVMQRYLVLVKLENSEFQANRIHLKNQQ